MSRIRKLRASREAVDATHRVVKYKDDMVGHQHGSPAQKSTLWICVKQSPSAVIGMINTLAMIGSGLGAPQLFVITRVHVLNEQPCHWDKV